ncbi:MAG: T9SS type A sorting domain-containing protein, partial [Bacteroidales bacterium]|nr:T9SS type A sorting domain-containing protein [Bacteroidales bacterium]
YSYAWSGGAPMFKYANTQSVGMMAADDYSVTVTDSHGCTAKVDFTVTQPDEITSDAGIDQQICYDGTITLAGSYTVAGGGIWSGGTGTFDPDNTTMNAIYTPSAAEIAAGMLSLTLTTTDNGPCNAASDEMEITIYPEPKWTYTINGEAYITGIPIEICDGIQTDIVAGNFVGTVPIQGKRQLFFNGTAFSPLSIIHTSDLTDFSQNILLPLGNWELIFSDIQDAHGCTATSPMMASFSPQVIINPNPTAIIESNDPICIGTGLELSGVYDEIFCTVGCEEPQGYCSSYSSIGDYQYISNFKLNNTRNLSGEGNYTRYDQSSFKTLYIDSTYQVTLTIAGPMNYPHYNIVFVDWNRDGDFEDADESYEIGGMIGIGTITNTITVPSSALMGKTMLRVVNRKNSYAPACGNYPVGETEDYLIEIKSVDANSIMDYTWSSPAGAHNGKYLSINATIASDDGLYSLTVTNTHGCTTTTTHQTIVANPQIDFSLYEIYQEAPFIISLNPGTFETYIWSDGSTQSSLLVNDFGAYSVTVSEYDCIDSDSLTFNEVQYITLNQGWDMFSTYINQTANIEDVLSGFPNSVQIVKDNAGHSYWPSFGVNAIQNMMVGQGYQVKMYHTEILTIEGISVIPEITPISLYNGINLVGMLRHNPVSATELFAPVTQHLVYVKLNNGMVYLPQYQINQVVTLYPDEAFKVMMLSPASITYPANAAINMVKETPVLNEPMYYPALCSTGSDMTLIIPDALLQPILKSGDEVAVFSSTGRVVGSAVYQGETIAMPLWGEDKTSQVKSGLSHGEEFVLELFNHQTGEVARFESIKYAMGDGVYHENSLAILESFNLDLHFSIQVYPNPATEYINVNFSLSDAMDTQLEIYNSLGQLVFVKEIQKEAGFQTERIALSNFSSGIYTLRMRSQDEVKEANFIVK